LKPIYEKSNVEHLLSL